jgi:hypothetical protein
VGGFFMGDNIMEDRMAAIGGLPAEVRDFCLVDWKTVALLLGLKDVEHTRKLLADAGVPLVRVSERRNVPTWGALRQFIKSREM